MATFLRRTDEGSTHWLGDDGYPACWRDHRECAEERVARLEAALRDALRFLEAGGMPPGAIGHLWAMLPRIGNQG